MGKSGKIKLDMPVIVEGKYDKITLSEIIDGIIITTDGFGIYKNKEKLSLIRRYAQKSGVIILTDSDRAGFQIRNSLKGMVTGRIINVYIPDIYGKERRKEKPSKEGKLGVEGIDKEILLKAFRDAGVICGEEKPRDKKEVWISRQRLAEDGFSGGENSSELRKALCKRLSLPERLTTKGLYEALSSLVTEEEYLKAVKEIKQ